MTQLTGEEIIAIVSGPAGAGETAALKHHAQGVRISDLDGAPDGLRLALTAGGNYITVAALKALIDEDDAEDVVSPVRVALLSGGNNFSARDYFTYINVVSVAGLLTEVSVIEGGQGYLVGDVAFLAEDADSGHGRLRVRAVDHFGGITDAKVINPWYYHDGVQPEFGDGTGTGAEFFATTSREDVDGVIQQYDVDTGGDGWSVGDAVTVDNGDGDVASGQVLTLYQDLPPDLEVVSTYAGSSNAITAVTQGSGIVAVAGDITAHLPVGRQVAIVGGANAGTYWVSAAAFATGHTSATLKGPPKATITLADLPVAGNTVTVNHVVLTFVDSGPAAHQVLIGVDVTATATNLAAAIVTEALGATVSHALGVVTLTWPEADVAGEDYTLAKVGTNIAVSAAHLTFVTALTSAVVAGNLVLGPEIVVRADNEGDDLNAGIKVRFTNLFDEDPDVSKRLSVLPSTAPTASGDLDRPDQYTLYINPYSTGSTDFAVSPPDIDAITLKGEGQMTAVDLYVFGSEFEEDTYDIDGVGTGATLIVSAVIGYPAP